MMSISRFRLFLILALVGAVSCAARPPDALNMASRIAAFQHALPTVRQPIQGTSHEAYYFKAIRYAGKLKVGVVELAEEDMPLEADGVFYSEIRAIAIRQDQTPNGKFATMVHELGHVLQPVSVKGVDGDIFAETVAQIVCECLQLDMWRESFRYMLSGNVELTYINAVQMKYAREIDAAADAILRGIR